MTGTDLAGLAFRVWGVMWMLSGLLDIPQAALIPLSFGDANEINQSILGLAALLTIVVQVAIGGFLFVRGQWVADTLFAHYDLPVNVGISAPDLQAILLGLLGLYLIFEGIQQYAMVLYHLQVRPEWQTMSSVEYAWLNEKMRLLGGAIDLLFGAAVLFGRAGFARAWRAIHPMGVSEVAGSDEEETREP